MKSVNEVCVCPAVVPLSAAGRRSLTSAVDQSDIFSHNFTNATATTATTNSNNNNNGDDDRSKGKGEFRLKDVISGPNWKKLCCYKQQQQTTQNTLNFKKFWLTLKAPIKQKRTTGSPL